MKKNEKFLLNLFIILLIINNMLQSSLYLKIPELIGLGIEAISYIYFAILLIKYLKIKKWKLIFLFLVIVLTIYTGIVTNNLTLLSSIMFLTVTVIYKDRDIIKLSNRVIGIILFIHAAIYLIQMALGSVSVSADFSGRTRYLLGFEISNTSGIFALWWVLGKTYLSNYNIKKVCFYVVIIFIFYYFNRCRSMMYCTVILLIISICINKNIGTRIIKFLSKNIIIIMTAFMLIAVNLYNMNFEPAVELNEVFSNRIFFSAQAINDNGYTLVGQKVKDTIVVVDQYKGNLVIDVTYVALSYRYGLIYILLLILLSRYIVKTRSEKEYGLLIIYGVFAFLEIYSLNFIICFPMLFGASWIGEKNDT